MVTSDAGLLAYRELDALGLSTMAGKTLADARTGRNGRHALVGLLRQSLFDQRQREALDCHAFTSNRQEECARMPGKMARSAPLTTVRAARCAGGRPHLAAVLQERRKYANIHARSGVRGIPVHSRQSSSYWDCQLRSAPSR